MGTRHEFVSCFVHYITLRRIDMLDRCLLPENPREVGREIHAEEDWYAGRGLTSRKPEEVCSCLICWVKLGWYIELHVPVCSILLRSSWH